MGSVSFNDKRLFPSGVSNVILFTDSGKSIAWSGVISIDEKFEVKKDKIIYLDGLKTEIKNRHKYETYTITSFLYPDFLDINVRKQREIYHLVYKKHFEDRYEIHFVYGLVLSDGIFNRKSNTGNPYYWTFAHCSDMYTVTSHLYLSSYAYPGAVQDIETILYGSDEKQARLLFLEEIMSILEIYAVLKVTDNGDNTALISGPSSAIEEINVTTYKITWDSVLQIEDFMYKISSL